jgi:hypothetical protein
MPKMLIIEPTIVNYEDGQGGQHAGPDEEVSLGQDQCLTLAKEGKALYLEAKDDPFKGRYVVPERILAVRESEKKGKKSAPADQAA